MANRMGVGIVGLCLVLACGGVARADCYDVCNSLTKDAAQTCDQYDKGEKLADVLADDETVNETATQRNTVLDMDRAVYHDKEAGESTGDIIRDVVDNCKKDATATTE